LFQSQDITVI